MLGCDPSQFCRAVTPPRPTPTTAAPTQEDHRMAMLAESVDGVIGVDTHRDTLTAAAVTSLGGVLAQTTTGAEAAGYQRLLDFACVQVPGRRCWAGEGTGSFGAGLAEFLQQHGEQVVEVGRPKRPASRSGANSDALDAVRTRPRGAWPRPPGDPTASGPAGGAAGAACHPPLRHPGAGGRHRGSSRP